MPTKYTCPAEGAEFLRELVSWMNSRNESQNTGPQGKPKSAIALIHEYHAYLKKIF